MRFIKVGVTITASFVALVALAATLSAQGNSNNNGNNAILQAIQALQRTVNGLVTTVNAIYAATTPGNVLFTPVAAVFAGDSAICFANNVSSNAERNIQVALIDSDAGSIVSESAPDVPVLPGQYAVTSFSVPTTSLPRMFFCRITVANGTKNDVRGVLNSFNNPTNTLYQTVTAQ